MEVILWPPSLNSSVFHLLEDKVRFSVPLRIRILENMGEGGHTGRANDDELGAGPPPEEVRGPSIPLSVCGVSHPSEAAGE